MNVFVTAVLTDLHAELEPYYNDTGRPSVDPEFMIRMLLVGYCYGIRSERRHCQEVELHLSYRGPAGSISMTRSRITRHHFRSGPKSGHDLVGR
jgi:transposase